MKRVCPLCNGLYEIEISCPNCGRDMSDNGPVVNYLDNYSPYLLDDISHTEDGAAEDECTHLFCCPSCGKDKRVGIRRVEI